jgi:Bacterial extracellular solute-binding protein
MSGDPSAEPPAPSYEPLQEALNRAVARPWWRRWLRTPGRPWWKGGYPVMGALAAVVVLSLIGIAAPWDRGPSPARGGDALGPAGSVLASPTPSPADPRSIVSRPEAGDAGTTAPCAPPLSVVTAPDIAGLVSELAGPLTDGSCPKATVTAQAPATTLDTLAGGTAPHVWIPDSSLWLRLADGDELPAAGTSIARTPVVLAVPQPVADQLRSEDAWPVWLVFYDKVTTGAIPRMSMAPPDSTVGALTLVAFADAADYHWADEGEGSPFLHMLNFRNHLAATDADPEVLLDRLAGTAVASSDTEVGVFPVTEQRLLAYLDSDPPTPAVATGTYEAMSEADYPMAISESLDSRLAGVADELLTRLRSQPAVQRLVELGFRPPRGEQILPAALDDTGRFPDYPEPVSLPDAAGWQKIVNDWSFSG